MATLAGALRHRTGQKRKGGLIVSLALADHICRCISRWSCGVECTLWPFMRLWKAEFRNFSQRFQQRQVKV